MKKILAPFLLVLLLPVVGYGQPDFTWIDGLVDGFGDVVTTLIPIIIALALLVFIWGLVQFIANSGDDAAKQEGKNKMIWGVLALFVIVAIWGIVNLLADILGVTQTATPTEIPTVTY